MARLRKKPSAQARVNMAASRRPIAPRNVRPNRAAAASFTASQNRGAAANQRANFAAKAAAPKPVAPPAPAFTPQAQNELPAPLAPTAPPQNAGSASSRSGALTTYQTAVNSYKQGLVNAALRLGSPEVINTLMQNPDYAEYVGALQQGLNDPYSVMKTLDTNQGRALSDVDSEANSRGGFFSGFRLDSRGRTTEDFDRQRRDAMGEYNTAQNEATTGIGTAKGTYEGDIGRLDYEDWVRAQEAEPEVGSGTQTPANPLAPVYAAAGANTNPRSGFSLKPGWEMGPNGIPRKKKK